MSAGVGVSLLFITMIPIDCKTTKLLILVCLLFYNLCIPLQKTIGHHDHNK